VQLEGEGLEEEPKALLPRMKRLPAKRVVHLPREGPDPQPFSLRFEPGQALPPGQAGPLLGEFTVAGAPACALLPLPHASPHTSTFCAAAVHPARRRFCSAGLCGVSA
jgi:hypothetical protein